MQAEFLAYLQGDDLFKNDPFKSDLPASGETNGTASGISNGRTLWFNPSLLSVAEDARFLQAAMESQLIKTYVIKDIVEFGMKQVAKGEIGNGLNPGVTNLAGIWSSSGWKESWEELLAGTDDSRSWAEVIFRVKMHQSALTILTANHITIPTTNHNYRPGAGCSKHG